jgi:hypothetical protein
MSRNATTGVKHRTTVKKHPTPSGFAELFHPKCECGWKGRSAYTRKDALEQARVHRVDAQISRGRLPKEEL